jgi:hypothetical protein
MIQPAQMEGIVPFPGGIQPAELRSGPAPDLQSQGSQNLKNFGENRMANISLPLEERNLNPDQVEALDKRREWGLTLQVIAGQFAVICVVLSLWVGQDLTYSPGWAHPMAFYMAIALGIVFVCGTTGTIMRRGTVPLD